MINKNKLLNAIDHKLDYLEKMKEKYSVGDSFSGGIHELKSLKIAIEFGDYDEN